MLTCLGSADIVFICRLYQIAEDMNENRFFKKYETKSDVELERIVNDKKAYVEQARIAAIQILKERNGRTELTDKAENEIQTVKDKTEEVEKKNNFLTDNPNAPQLHSKRVITFFAAIFSTIFGTVLMMYNFNQVGNTKARNQVLVFGLLYTILSIIIINLFPIAGNLAIILNLGGALVLTEYFWNDRLGAEIEYRERSWVRPLIISFVITIPLVLAVIYRN